MMNPTQSPMQELDQEMRPQAQPVHHTGPGGPRQRQTAAIDELKGIRQGLNPQDPNSQGYARQANTGMNQIAKERLKGDVSHIINLMEGVSDAEKFNMQQTIMNAINSGSGLLGDGGQGAVQGAFAGAGQATTDEQMFNLQQDIRNQQSGRGTPSSNPMGQ